MNEPPKFIDQVGVGWWLVSLLLAASLTWVVIYLVARLIWMAFFSAP
ncbi:MAG TPA: hypothetical protein VGM83_18950 [Devosiaceae bacterium]